MTGSRIEQPAIQPTPKVGAESRPGFSWTKALSLNPEQIQKLIPWVMKGGLALLDQGVFAGSNFVMSILLARWMPPEQYGAYAVAFAVFLFLVNCHQSLLLEPMMVFGSSVYRNSLRGYLKSLLLAHVVMSVVMSAGLCIAAVVMMKFGQASALPGALLGIAVAAPAVLLFWVAKRVFYLKLSPGPSAAGATLYGMLVIGGLALVYQRSHSLTPLGAFLLMGICGLGASLALLVYLRSKLPKTTGAPSLMDTWRRHWRYGRWALAANIMMWVPINAFYPILSKFSGMAQAGELKALMNFASPMLQACAALHTLLLPYSARVLEQRPGDGAHVVLRRMTFLCVACAIPYWLVLLLFRGPAFRMLYSGRYTEVAYLLPVVALASVAGSAFFGPSIVLRSLEEPRLIFAAVTVSSLASVLVGIPLTRAWGVGGAVWSIVVSEALAFVAAVVLLRRKAGKAYESGSTLGSCAANASTGTP